MLQKLIRRFLGHRHYWRDIGFDELSELYTSMMFRSMAQSIVGIFIPIYLYKLGYEIAAIFLFFAWVYIFWQMAAIAGAWIVARVGPKHSMLMSHFLIVASMAMLVSLGSVGWPLILIALFFGASNGLFFLAFHIDFSKVKHSKHGGKEVGWMFVMQKTGLALGPIIGGVVAYFFGAQYIFLVSIILLFLGTLPLLSTAEPIKTRQFINFSALPIRRVSRDIFSHAAQGTEALIQLTVWPFFIALIIFPESPYINLGFITSVSVVIAFLASRSIGVLIDKQKGRQLLRLGATANAGLHIFRPYANSLPAAFGINMLSEAISPMFRMPYFKGMYDAADDYPGSRIVYISVMESTCAFAKALFFISATIIAYYISDIEHIFRLLFLIGVIMSLLIMTERFRALE